MNRENRAGDCKRHERSNIGPQQEDLSGIQNIPALRISQVEFLRSPWHAQVRPHNARQPTIVSQLCDAFGCSYGMGVFLRDQRC